MNKTNEELGIYRLSADLKPFMDELEKSGVLDLRGVSVKHKTKLGRIAKSTGLIEYVPFIRRKIGFRVTYVTPKKITVDTREDIPKKV